MSFILLRRRSYASRTDGAEMLSKAIRSINSQSLDQFLSLGRCGPISAPHFWLYRNVLR